LAPGRDRDRDQRDPFRHGGTAEDAVKREQGHRRVVVGRRRAALPSARRVLDPRTKSIKREIRIDIAPGFGEQTDRTVYLTF
jgi:hypothetical protein